MEVTLRKEAFRIFGLIYWLQLSLLSVEHMSHNLMEKLTEPDVFHHIVQEGTVYTGKKV